MEVQLQNVKVTKNMIRFEEVDASGAPSKTVFNGIAQYINKSALNGLPKAIILTIKEVE